MSHTDWEARYQSGDMPWEKGAPSPGLVDFLAANRNLTGETVCVPGCGTGHDAREWAKANFSVYGYDLAPSAIQLSRERTQAAGLHAEFQLGDFPAWLARPSAVAPLRRVDRSPARLDWWEFSHHSRPATPFPGGRDAALYVRQGCLTPRRNWDNRIS